MKSRYLIIGMILWCSLLIWWYFMNAWLPLWFDHGAYKHFTLLIGNHVPEVMFPEYLQFQFEPYSGTFFYSLWWFLWWDLLYSWGYLGIFVLTCISLIVLWKKWWMYTYGAYLGGFLFLFSSIQYSNLWWSFGKQLFATFFLILLIKYYKKIPIMLILLTACLSLHRLTWVLALFTLLLLHFSHHKKSLSYLKYICIAVALALMTYAAFFYEQIIFHFHAMFLGENRQLFFHGPYGTGFPPLQFWIRLMPSMILVCIWIVSIWQKKTAWWKMLRNPEVWVAWILFVLVWMRSIAHTRLWSFLELFLIILVVRYVWVYIRHKWIYGILIFHVILWITFAGKYHTPFVDKKEQNIIQSIVREMPDTATLVTLSGAYMSWISGYTDREIYSLYQGVSSETWTDEERYLMRYYPKVLCKNLWKIPGDVFVFRWVNESFFPSLEKNSCLKTVAQWGNGSALMFYSRTK